MVLELGRYTVAKFLRTEYAILHLHTKGIGR